MRGSDWTVVGVFESGDAHDSELWTDINVARTTFGSQRLELGARRARGSGGFEQAQGALAADPRVNVDVVREQDYFSGQTKQFRKTIGFLAGVVTIIMALGAVFAGSQQHVCRGHRAWQGDRDPACNRFRRTAGTGLGDARGAAAWP